MRRPHPALIIGLAVLVLGTTAFAQTVPPPPAMPAIPPPGSTVTLAQAIDLALANNPQTRTAWLEARAAEFAVGSARSAYYPEIDVLWSIDQPASDRIPQHVADMRRIIFVGSNEVIVKVLLPRKLHSFLPEAKASLLLEFRDQTKKIAAMVLAGNDQV